MNPMTDLPQMLIGEFGRTTEMFLAWFKRFDLRRSTSGEQKIGFHAKLGPCAISIQFKQNSKFFSELGEKILFFVEFNVFDSK